MKEKLLKILDYVVKILNALVILVVTLWVSFELMLEGSYFYSIILLISGVVIIFFVVGGDD